MDQDLQNAIAAALKLHEIGHGDPYRLSFASKGNSGASFGSMQGDLSVQPLARDTLRSALLEAQVPSSKIDQIIATLSHPAITNPLSAEDDATVTAALSSPAGRRLVDTMDNQILSEVIDAVDECIAAAETTGHEIEPKATIYIALWINMTGAPTTLKQWL